MSVSREVILDLIPLVQSGAASPASRELVESYLKEHPELAERVRVLEAEGFAPIASSELPPDLELRSLRRTKRLLGVQRWLFGLGIAFTAMALSMRFTTHDGGVSEFHFLLMEHPVALGSLLLIGVALLAAYFILRRRLRQVKG